ncbi:protein KTI12 homolog [Pararge aegeria]|uniref:Protein KTI12 homolog n=3 Tax=Pararge aegeria TaxID=116150 RepID=A0A8S4RL22_9NEOP|nr:protein KTI12 homolog [Pararge aegeria]CAH2238003.1 jg10328 [Pararge aegeria aegeria]
MPLIIICGTPVSGKTSRTTELKQFFENVHNKNVEIVSEDEAIIKLGYEKNSTYLDSQKEKRVRGYLKSEVIRLIGKDNVVILDGSNYIKGYRYELYCASKASKSTQCTIYTIRNQQEAWDDNIRRIEANESKPNDNPDLNKQPYTEEVFNALTKLRFEEPNSNNRWDSPLFTVQTTSQLDLDAVYKVLFEKKPPPPNMSTQNPPLSSTNFLYEIDKVTQAISKQILDSKQLNLDIIKFPEYPGCVLEVGFIQSVNPQKLLRLRRQFLTYAKMSHSNEEANKIGRFYIQYLNKTLTD